MPKENNDTTYGYNENFKNFLKVKNFLMSYYQNIASAQAVRLIGFTAGVFTLIGATKLSPEEHLSEFFSGASILLLKEGIPPALSSSINFLFFSGTICILFFFVFRAIFRYTTFSHLADTLIHVGYEKTKKGKTNDIPLHALIVKALIAHIEEHPRKVFGMPISYFFSYSGNTKTKWGVLISSVLSVSATFLLLLLIW